MSYEGFDQYLCKNGHLSEFDCYHEIELNEDKCNCGSVFVFRHSVDETNGYDESNLGTSRYPFEINTEAEYENCNLGHKHIAKRETFKIPIR